MKYGVNKKMNLLLVSVAGADIPWRAVYRQSIMENLYLYQM